MDQRKLMDNANTITDMAKTQNSVYELVSDMNQRQELLEERVIALEVRIATIAEQLESLPETFSNIIQKALNTHLHQTLNRTLSPPSLNDNTQQNTSNPLGNHNEHRHTHLHPNDAASLATRPSWSTFNLTSPGGPSAGRQSLNPMVPRAGSFDA
ncbi:small conductance calcium-activated potassium channel protein-like protein [Dinothrombium tinctorium]|uniref:Small conductance calcium-activated potassium channel protein-like protein n=1 Tax=Dinothrombium tinctorium TaxID=1965070 RepID=A0A3S3P030_9ACAR|nr:small conductance calcium-activated potassium channel protein-like protein [Dinothrombium tinctorium]